MNRLIFFTSGQKLQNLAISQVDNDQSTIKTALPCPYGINSLSSLYVRAGTQHCRPLCTDPVAHPICISAATEHGPFVLFCPCSSKSPWERSGEGMLSFTLCVVGCLLQLQTVALDSNGACFD